MIHFLSGSQHGWIVALETSVCLYAANVVAAKVPARPEASATSLLETRAALLKGESSTLAVKWTNGELEVTSATVPERPKRPYQQSRKITGG